MTSWLARALDEHNHRVRVEQVRAELHEAHSTAMVDRFRGRPLRVDRMQRGLLRILSVSGGATGVADAARAGSVDAMLAWARQRWSTSEAQVLRDAWSTARKKSDGDDLVAIEAMATFLHDVRQDCRRDVGERKERERR